MLTYAIKSISARIGDTVKHMKQIKFIDSLLRTLAHFKLVMIVMVVSIGIRILVATWLSDYFWSQWILWFFSARFIPQQFQISPMSAARLWTFGMLIFAFIDYVGERSKQLLSNNMD